MPRNCWSEPFSYRFIDPSRACHQSNTQAGPCGGFQGAAISAQLADSRDRDRDAKMRALAIVHQPDAGPGVFAEAMSARGVELDEWLPPDAPAPADPFGYDAVLTFGGAMHADQEEQHPWLAAEKALLAGLIERRIP